MAPASHSPDKKSVIPVLSAMQKVVCSTARIQQTIEQTFPLRPHSLSTPANLQSNSSSVSTADQSSLLQAMPLSSSLLPVQLAAMEAASIFWEMVGEGHRENFIFVRAVALNHNMVPPSGLKMRTWQCQDILRISYCQ